MRKTNPLLKFILKASWCDAPLQRYYGGAIRLIVTGSTITVDISLACVVSNKPSMATVGC